MGLGLLWDKVSNRSRGLKSRAASGWGLPETGVAARDARECTGVSSGFSLSKTTIV